MEIVILFVGGKFCYLAWKAGEKKVAFAIAAMFLASSLFALRVDYCIIKHVDLFTGRSW